MSEKVSDKISFKEGLNHIRRGYAILHALMPSFISLSTISSLINVALPFVTIYFSAQILNELAGERDIRVIVIYIIAAVVSAFIIAVARSFISRKQEIMNSMLWDKVYLHNSNRFTRLDYEYVEKSSTSELLADIAAKTNAHGLGIMRLYWYLPSLLQGLFGVAASCILVAGMFKISYARMASFIASPYTVFILAASIILLLILSFQLGKVRLKKLKQVYNDQPKINTSASYYFHYIMSGGAGKDIRIYDQKPVILRIFSEFINMTLWFGYLKTMGFTDGLLAAANALVGGAVYLLIGLRALAGMYAIGSVIQYIGGMTNLVTNLTLFFNTCTNIWTNNIYLKSLYEYLDLPDIKYTGSLTTEKRTDNEYEIEFHNVSFKYPGSDTYALKNFNLKLNVGERLAVVGMNGSGKTTMIKLLCRLYDPTEGEITLNGIDIIKYDQLEYMAIFSVVFQDFKLFAFPLGQNVASAVSYNAERVKETLEKTGFDERSGTLPKDYDTALYKDFDENGVEISGGEAQKIALARALYKDAPFIVLDEPTAALDPIAEYEIYMKFDEIVKDKTTIYISHRLSSCRFCDDIAVFHEGELIQRGSHDTLLQDTDGKYHELWNAQAQYYNTPV